VLGDGRMPSPDGRAGVTGDPHTAMERLDGSLRDPHLNHLSDQRKRCCAPTFRIDLCSVILRFDFDRWT